MGTAELVFLSPPHPRYVAQQRDWDCGLAAFRTSFRAYFGIGRDFPFRSWLRILRASHFVPNELGIPFPTLAYLGWLFDMRPTMFLGPEYTEHVRQFRFRLPHRPKRKAFLRALRLAEQVRIPVKRYRRRATIGGQLRECLSQDGPIILRGACSEFYGIEDDDYSHYVALLCASGVREIADPMLAAGRREYGSRRWPACLKAAQNFDSPNQWEASSIIVRIVA